MERPFKRPRLSMFPDQGSDAELDAARYQNDLQLKTRFEAIFEKYSQDFSEVGDEIDVLTGNIVINNGHLESMAGETDTGASNSFDSFVNGESILRAITEAADNDGSYLENEGNDDVLASIETIAENAAFTADQTSEEDSEDELLDPAQSELCHRQLPNQSRDSSESLDSLVGQKVYSSDSETDSLFDVQMGGRSSSPDSLFGDQKNTRASRGNAQFDSTNAATNGNLDDDAILSKFGDLIGHEVLEILEKRAVMTDAHIEPAWRLPIDIRAKSISHSESHSATPVVVTIPSNYANISPEKRESIWAKPRSRKNKQITQIEPQPNRVRAESEDPLQEDFAPIRRPQFRPSSPALISRDGSEYAEEEEEQDFEDEEEDEEYDNFEKLIQNGTCPYCETHFKGRAAVMSHWTRVLRKSDNGKMENDIHDLPYISAFKAAKSRRSRGPRLTLYDFRTMVELHEGGGLTFQEIASAEALRTQKNAARLHDLYDLHRSSQDWSKEKVPFKDWTDEEDKLLKDLCTNPLVTLATLARQLKGRTEIEIGDRLADEWLDELRAKKNQQASFSASAWNSFSGMQHSFPPLCQNVPVGNTYSQNLMAHHYVPSGAIYVKTEESEDELFD